MVDESNRKRRGAGLKINNNKSSIEAPSTEIADNFKQKAAETFNKIESYKQRMWELSGRFKSILEDKTLPENKTILSKNLDKEILEKLITLASEMNTDQTQPEGFGSATIEMLLMKMLLLQNDKINTLSYQLSQLEKQVKK